MEDLLRLFLDLPVADRAKAFETILRNLYQHADDTMFIDTADIELFMESAWHDFRQQKGGAQ